MGVWGELVWWKGWWLLTWFHPFPTSLIPPYSHPTLFHSSLRPIGSGPKASRLLLIEWETKRDDSSRLSEFQTPIAFWRAFGRINSRVGLHVSFAHQPPPSTSHRYDQHANWQHSSPQHPCQPFGVTDQVIVSALRSDILLNRGTQTTSSGYSPHAYGKHRR